MKNFVFLTLMISLVIIGCKKEDDPVVSSTGYTATVDGQSWRAQSVQASIFNGTMVVIGTSSDGSEIIFSLSGDSVGLYPVNENTTSSASFTIEGSKAFTSGASSLAGGQILIEEVSIAKNKITGSIELTAVRASDDSTIKITNGRFVGIVYDNIPIGIQDNSLQAKINGSNWAPQDVSGFVAFKTIFLKAIDSDEIRTLTFELPELIGPGNYNLNFFTNYKSVYVNIAGKKHYAVSGNLEIVSHNLVNREIEANFDVVTEAYEGGGIVRFTEGKFKIIYE